MMKSAGQGYEIIVLADASGTVFADGSANKARGIKMTDRDYFKAAMNGKTSVGAATKSRSSGKPAVQVAAPIQSPSGEVVGVASLVISMDYISDKLASVKLGNTGYAFALDKSGLAIAHPKKEQIFELNFSTTKGVEDIWSKMKTGQAGADFYVLDHVKKIAGFAPVPITGWTICVTQNEEEVMSAAHSTRNVVMLIGGILLGIAVICTIFFSRSITNPITRSVRQLNEAADQVASASGQVSSASQSLAEGSSEQAASIEETSSSLEEMSSMTKQNADNASCADQLMKEAKQLVVRANGSMTELNHSMNDISKASEETSKIIKTIDEIAFQTNLLALNAAVEAARAGEAGAGFAVVANEVRNLAMRAADAARSTSLLIEGTVKKVKEGSEFVEHTNEAFSEVSKSAAKVADLVSEIAAASIEQSQGIDQINKAVTEMDKVTQKNAANAEESASASEEMSAQSEQMKEVAHALMSIVGGNIANDTAGNPPSASGGSTGLMQKFRAIRPVKGRENIDGKNVRPKDVIPLSDGDFKNF